MKSITKCLGYQQLNAAATTVAVGLTVPTDYQGAKPNWCLIQVEAQALRYRDDGANPTTTVGMLIPAGETLVYEGDLNAIRLINAVAGSIANISYYL